MQFLYAKKLPFLITLIGILYVPIIFATETVQLISQKNLPNNLGVYRHLQIELEEPQGVVHLHVAVLNDQYQAALYQQSESRQSLAKFMDQLAKQENFQIAINGGFYTRDFKPAGLFKLEGQVLRPLAADLLLSSCIGIDKQHKLFLGENRYSCLQQFNALQTGPLLINNSKVNKDLEWLQQRVGKSSAFFSTHRRTLLAKSSDNKILIIIASSVRLLDVAYLLQKYAKEMGTKDVVRAIDLDGGSSTGMYIRFPDQAFYFPELKHVKTLIFFE